jgi:hypothetical protein
LGYFNNEVDAAEAYDFAAIELFGEYAYLNFPDKNYNNFKLNKRDRKTSRFVGVSVLKNGKYRASVFGDSNKTVHIGYFNSEIDAAMAYNNYVIEHNLNRKTNDL